MASAPLAGWLEPLRKLPQTRTHAYHLYVVRLVRRPGESLERLAGRRKALYLALREKRIYTQVHYIPVPMQPYYQARRYAGDPETPGALAYYAACLSLPMYPLMRDADVARVVEALHQCRDG